MRHYNSLNEYYRAKFGDKVYKLSINGGMTCPNRDGTIDYRGCIFCSKGGSGEFSQPSELTVTEQLERAKKLVEEKIKSDKYIAYFQPFSNTYARVDYLEKIFTEAIKPEYIVGLSIATRPDCLDDEKIELLNRLNKIKPVSVELGLQTIHKKSSDYIRRGYELEIYEKAAEKLKKSGLEVVTHVILGLPGESEEMMLDTVKYVGKRTNGIKLQLLHVIKGTDLEKEYEEGKFEVMSLEEYADIICKAIELLPAEVVVHRITGDGYKRTLVAPSWSADKKKVLNYINKELDKRNVVQGSKLFWQKG